MHCSREDLLGQHVRVLQPDGLPQEKEILAALLADGGWAGDLQAKAPDGSVQALRCAALAFRDPAGTPYQYVAVATPLGLPPA